MREAAKTALRYLALLQMLPAQRARRISVSALQQRLRDSRPEFAVSNRTIQRDLHNLSEHFPIVFVPEGRINYWHWQDATQVVLLPTMDANTALAFQMAADRLHTLLPTSALELLSPHIKTAEATLRQTKFGKWSTKIRIINRGPALTPPPVHPSVRDAVYTALVTDSQFAVDYQSKHEGAPWRRVLSPLGLVVRDGILYLVATSEGYRDARHYLLHRMSRAKVLDRRAIAPARFDFARYVAKSFAYPVTDQTLRLRALFAEAAAFHLSESKLSADQTITPQEDGRMLVEATVDDTTELRWWLLGFGSDVEVLEPRALRDEFAAMAKAMAGIYARRKK